MTEPTKITFDVTPAEAEAVFQHLGRAIDELARRVERQYQNPWPQPTRDEYQERLTALQSFTTKLETALNRR